MNALRAVSALPSVPFLPKRTSDMPTMTITEAETILDIVSEALQETSHRHHHPVSALKGHDIHAICTALKLRVANEFLMLSGTSDGDERFAQGLTLYDGIPWSIIGTFVPDEQLHSIIPELAFDPADPVTMTLRQPLASNETASSFGGFCRAVGAKDPHYWERVYARIGLEYTTTAPRGNNPVRPSPG
jgi:hypothetical protein